MPPGAVPGLLDHQRRTGWQLAQQVWEDSGVSWEGAGQDGAPASVESGYASGDTWTAHYLPEPADLPESPDMTADPLPEPPVDADADAETDRWNDYPTGGFPGRSWPDDDNAWVTPPPADYAHPAYAAQSAYGAPSGYGAGEYAGYSPAPLSAPVGLAPPKTRPAAASQELFRAWQGSVREAAAPARSWPAPRPGRTDGTASVARTGSAVWTGSTGSTVRTGGQAGSARRRRQARQAAKIGVPAVVIVTVGAGALLMLTGRANEMLAERATNGALASATPVGQTAPAAGIPSTSAGVSLPGYPGQQGALTVGSLTSAGGSDVAVGSADGRPATWRRAHDATWPLVSVNVLSAVTGQLTGLAHGAAGWIAVGSATAGGTSQPFAVTSFGAVNWAPMLQLTALAGVHAQLLGVAAGPGGYVVVGQVITGHQAQPAAWWSANLRTWQPVQGGGLDASLTTAALATASLSAASVNAVAAVPSGFVAVGSHGAFPAIWTSTDGQHWSMHAIAVPPGAQSTVPPGAQSTVPPGAQSAKLNVLATSGTRVVAGGHDAGPGGDIPIVASSIDGGGHWTQVILPVPHARGTVTAITATGTEFVAAGLAGPPGARQPVAWTSRDGLTWSAATPLNQAEGTITALSQATTSTALTAAAQQGASTTVRAVPIP